MSLISLVILSYDRYSTLTVYNKRGPDYRRPLLAVGGSWLYSLFWTVPPLLGWSSYGIEGAGTSCSVSWTVQTAQSHAYIICLFTFCLAIPILVMIYCYGRLLLAVKRVERCQRVCVCVYMFLFISCQLFETNHDWLVARKMPPSFASLFTMTVQYNIITLLLIPQKFGILAVAVGLLVINSFIN